MEQPSKKGDKMIAGTACVSVWIRMRGINALGFLSHKQTGTCLPSAGRQVFLRRDFWLDISHISFRPCPLITQRARSVINNWY